METITVKCMSFKGALFCNMLDQNHISFIHMSNACLHYVATFKALP